MAAFESFFERRRIRKQIDAAPDQALALALNVNNAYNKARLLDYAIKAAGQDAICLQAAEQKRWGWLKYTFDGDADRAANIALLGRSLDIAINSYEAFGVRTVSSLMYIHKAYPSKDALFGHIQKAVSLEFYAALPDLAGAYIEQASLYAKTKLFDEPVEDSKEGLLFSLLERFADNAVARAALLQQTGLDVSSLLLYVAQNAPERLTVYAGEVSKSGDKQWIRALNYLIAHNTISHDTFSAALDGFSPFIAPASADPEGAKSIMRAVLTKGWTDIAKDLADGGLLSESGAVELYAEFLNQPPIRQSSMVFLQERMRQGFVAQNNRAPHWGGRTIEF